MSINKFRTDNIMNSVDGESLLVSFRLAWNKQSRRHGTYVRKVQIKNATRCEAERRRNGLNRQNGIPPCRVLKSQPNGNYVCSAAA